MIGQGGLSVLSETCSVSSCLVFVVGHRHQRRHQMEIHVTECQRSQEDRCDANELSTCTLDAGHVFKSCL